MAVPSGTRGRRRARETGDAISDLGVAITASEAQRFEVLERLFAAEGRSLDEVPAEHTRRGPLSAWCWLVLTLNGITPEYRTVTWPEERLEPEPLSHYGIDLGFSSAAVRSFVFFLA